DDLSGGSDRERDPLYRAGGGGLSPEAFQSDLALRAGGREPGKKGAARRGLRVESEARAARAGAACPTRSPGAAQYLLLPAACRIHHQRRRRRPPANSPPPTGGCLYG